MVSELECLLRQEGRFCQTEEKKAEKFLAHNLSKSRQNINSFECVFSSKYFRIFYRPESKNTLEISISKKFFKLAVERNKIKRRVKEIFRVLSEDVPSGGVIIFSVFRPFRELSYADALIEIGSAVRSFMREIN